MRLTVLFALLLLSLGAQSQNGLRVIDPIGGAADRSAVRVPVETGDVEAFVRELARAWNGQRLEPYLDPSFPGRDRVLAGFPERVVPGTQLRVLSVGPVQTVAQERRGDALISTVVAYVRVQLEVPEADGGIRREASTQELVIRAERRVPE